MTPRRDYLLAFVTTSCQVCGPVWEMLATLASDEGGPGESGTYQLVVVTPSPSMEDERRARALTPAGALLHMSSATWFDYGVLQAGTFILLRAADAVGPQAREAPWCPPGHVLGSAVPSHPDELRSLVAGWQLRSGGPTP